MQHAFNLVRDEAAIAAAAGVDPLLRKSTVRALTTLTDHGIAVALQAGTFPKPCWLDGRNPAWFASDVRAWLEAKRAERGAPDPAREAVRAKQVEGGRKAQSIRKSKATAAA